MMFLETPLSLGTGEIQTMIALQADVSELFVYPSTTPNFTFGPMVPPSSTDYPRCGIPKETADSSGVLLKACQKF